MKKIQALTKDADENSFLEIYLTCKNSPLLRVVTH